MLYYITIFLLNLLFALVDVAYVDNSFYQPHKENTLSTKSDSAKDRAYEKMWKQLAIRHGRSDISHPTETGVEHEELSTKDMDRDRRAPSSDKHIRFGRGDSNFLRFGRPSDNRYKLTRHNNSLFLRFRRGNSDFIRFGRGDQDFETQRLTLDGRNPEEEIDRSAFPEDDELILNYEIKDAVLLRLLADVICKYDYNNCQQIEHY